MSYKIFFISLQKIKCTCQLYAVILHYKRNCYGDRLKIWDGRFFYVDGERKKTVIRLLPHRYLGVNKSTHQGRNFACENKR